MFVPLSWAYPDATSAASFSTCCRAASTRCATSACGIPPTARTPLGCATCCSSRPRRSPDHSRKQRCRRPTQSRPRRPPGRRSNRRSRPRCHHGRLILTAPLLGDRPWDRDPPPTHPPPSDPAPACPGTPQHRADFHAADGRRDDPDDTNRHPERVPKDHHPASERITPPTPNGDHHPRHPASRVKSP